MVLLQHIPVFPLDGLQFLISGSLCLVFLFGQSDSQYVHLRLHPLQQAVSLQGFLP
jgi:hypothetical protein